MAVYRYPLPSRRYRRGRYPYRYRRGSGVAVPPWLVVTAAVVALAGAGAGTRAVTTHGHAKAKAPAPAVTGNAVAARVTAFASARVGKVPYLWGGTTDAGMDCSGLAQAAWKAAGVSIERTSQQQWATERRVTDPVAGDLVFFAGSDGTPGAPGHVGIVTNPKKHLMIDAFAAGTYVREEGYGPAASPGTGLGAVVGFTDPAPVTVTAQAGGSAVATGRRLAAAYGWSSGAQWQCLYALWQHESNWDPYAANPASDARGIPQDINGWTDFAPGDVAAQVAWGLAYIRGRYVTPCAAWAFETSHTPNWY